MAGTRALPFSLVRAGHEAPLSLSIVVLLFFSVAVGANVERQLPEGVVVTYREHELNGTERVVFDGLATAEECALATRWLKEHAGPGSGYTGPDPQHFHTAHEALSGLFIQEAAKIAGRTPEVEDGLAAVELFLRLSDKVKASIEAFFNLPKPLYYQMEHMVCRRREDESGEGGDDWLSHGVHVDNCNTTQPDTCSFDIRYRDYSSVTFLNEDFENGRFAFFDPPQDFTQAITRLSDASVQAFVEPKCGRTVAYSAWVHNWHGVDGVRQGQRCVMATWLSYNRHVSAEEMMRDFAADKIKKIRASQASSHTSPGTDRARPVLLRAAKGMDEVAKPNEL